MDFSVLEIDKKLYVFGGSYTKLQEFLSYDATTGLVDAKRSFNLFPSRVKSLLSFL